jgi:hypothetical protein
MEMKCTDKNVLHWTNWVLLCNEHFKACNIWHTLMAYFTMLYWFSLWQMFKVATYKPCCIAQSTCLVSNLTTLQELKPRYAIVICQCMATSMSKTKTKQNYVVRFQLLLLCCSAVQWSYSKFQKHILVYRVFNLKVDRQLSREYFMSDAIYIGSAGMTLYYYMCRSWQDCCRTGENRSWPSISAELVDSECWCFNNSIFTLS